MPNTPEEIAKRAAAPKLSEQTQEEMLQQQETELETFQRRQREELTLRASTMKEMAANIGPYKTKMLTQRGELETAIADIPAAISRSDNDALARAKSAKESLVHELTGTCGELKAKINESQRQFTERWMHRVEPWNAAHAELARIQQEYHAAVKKCEAEIVALQPTFDSLNAEKTQFDIGVQEELHQVAAVTSFLVSLV